MAALFGWIREHEIFLAWMSVISLITFVGSLLAIPWFIVRIPSNYFIHPRHMLADYLAPRHPLLRAFFLILKNGIGVALILAGIAMLVLPGQGILTIVIGLILMDFPGKFALEQRVARQKGILAAMNWIREKCHHPPIEMPQEGP
jgi:hypothetical protein